MDWCKLDEHSGELPSCSSVLAPSPLLCPSGDKTVPAQTETWGSGETLGYVVMVLHDFTCVSGMRSSSAGSRAVGKR